MTVQQNGETLVLFKSEQRTRLVRHEYGEQNLSTSTSLVAQDGMLIAGVDIVSDADGKMVATWGAAFSVPEPILSYRLYRLLEALPVISKELLYAANVGVASNLKIIEMPGVDQARELLLEVLGHDVLDKVLRELPPDLEKMVSDLRSRKIYVETAVLQAEVEAGTIEMAPWLSVLGVDSNLKERLAALRERAEELRPALRKTLGSYHSSESCVQDMIDVAVDSYRRGINKEEHIVGMAILLHADRQLRAHHQLDELLRVFNVPPLFTLQREDLLLFTAGKVAASYRAIPAELADVLRTYRDEWNGMEIVA